jgi:lysophospholipase L1-like esterase
MKKQRLEGEDLERYRAMSNAGFAQRAKPRALAAARPGMAAANAGAPLVAVAEGDSWFDYLPAFWGGGMDLLGHLQASGQINVQRVSDAGDTLENMVYGTEFDPGNFLPEAAQIDKTLKKIKKYKPRVFLFSGGGNDIAGTELEAYLNPRDSGLDIIRQPYLDHMYGHVFPKMFSDLIARVHGVDPNIHIFLHGYDYAIPDGRGVGIPLLKWNFSGPWLRPAFTKKRRLEDAVRRDAIRVLIDRLNDMLADVARAHPRVHHLDFRGLLRSNAQYREDWANELHPTSDGFRKVAARMEEQILTALAGP